ncbi:MurR/RpiR family transcriptional regulator [Mesorhizobium sp. VK25A]|uniref:MurR/RpiR family transcriptional regulator n=1 Tax=Mesorhizobium vachelliae TaxID=3072309 RepID=A0ABU5AF56_9HYPH|nr:MULTISPECIES: MurR/RpiR family transcriptional regulator [unclassified Mesorhizobium]MDX8535888.1 MurR/RpiR family transcriptional regulator [Mesorhizobium sp. VK25D]MDX8548642.1 MurR/RpiR family transcriptional regulator [Mesorhizobium sp. VK25A]
MATPTNALNEKIRKCGEELTPGMRRVAEWMSRNQDEVALRSLRQIAQKTDVSPPTITRLTRTLGYQGFEELQQDCKEWLRAKSRFSVQAERLRLNSRQSSDPAGLLERNVASACAGLSNLAHNIPNAALEAAVRDLLAARSVWFVGSMSSGPIARYSSYIASLAFPNWHEVDLDSMATIATLGPEDMIIAIAFSPYATKSVSAVEIAAARGTRILSISDSPLSPIAEVARHLFVVSTENPGFFSTYVQPILLIETLIGLAISQAEEKAGDRIAAVEAALEASGMYWLSTKGNNE